MGWGRDFGRLQVVVREPEGTSVVPVRGRFLLRLAAIALPFLVYWLMATTPEQSRPQHAVPEYGELLLFLPVVAMLTVLSVVALVCSINMTGTRQRCALAVEATLVAATLLATVCGFWWAPAAFVASGA